MKKYAFTILYVFLLVGPLNATRNQQDSLRAFLEYIEEDSTTINQIMESQENAYPLEILDTYLISKSRLRYDLELQKLKWDIAWSDSVFVCKCAKYLTDKIKNDTALYLIDTHLLMAYYFSCSYGYEQPLLYECAEYAITIFHAKEAIAIINMDCAKKRNEKSCLYEMIQMILIPQKFVYTFDETTNKKVDAILAESNESSPYYVRFRNKLDGYSDMDLARISKGQEAELRNILHQGIANGEKKSQLTYAFMLLTGQFVEKDEKLGKELLSGVLK
ncbi:MAG: hypothetical protein J5621_06545 [Paludibacteraceae bacterium]|nr:hypothetical protein [Paludibacteraceae bacterium]